MYNIFITKTKKFKKRRAAKSAVRLAPQLGLEPRTP